MTCVFQLLHLQMHHHQRLASNWEELGNSSKKTNYAKHLMKERKLQKLASQYSETCSFILGYTGSNCQWDKRNVWFKLIQIKNLSSYCISIVFLPLKEFLPHLDVASNVEAIFMAILKQKHTQWFTVKIHQSHYTDCMLPQRLD